MPVTSATKRACSSGEEDLDVEILFDDPHRVVAGARSPWARRRKVALAELANEPWIFASNQVIRELIAEAFKAHGLDLGVTPRCVAILTLKNRTASPVVQLFVDQVRAVAKTMSVRSVHDTAATALSYEP